MMKTIIVAATSIIAMGVLGACGAGSSGEITGESTENVTEQLTASPTEEGNLESRKDPSTFVFTRIFCGSDNETHFETETTALTEVNAAPPAPPFFVGGGGAATSTLFAGFPPHWGDLDLQNNILHPTPVVQWATVVKGHFLVRTSDAEVRQFKSGDVLHVEDTAPCKGHITVNLTGRAAFLQFVR